MNKVRRFIIYLNTNL